MNVLQFLKDRARDYDCNVCGQNHSKSDIRVLGRLESAWIVRVQCMRCQTSFKLLVVIDEASLKPTPVRAGARLARERRRPAVTLDEVLDAHDFLQSYEGDLNALLQRRRTASPQSERA